MTKPDRRWRFNSRVIAGYAIAVGSVAAALAGSLWLEVYAVTAPVSLCLCAIMLSAWLGGLWPGLLASTLSVLAFEYYFVTPIYSLAVDIEEIPRFSVFALSAFLVGSLSAAQRSATESLRRARDHLNETVQELRRSNEALRAENAERIRAEEALRNAQADLARVARLTTMGELAASIAHEVNQPLMAVVTNAGICLRWLAHEPPDMVEARDSLGRILRDGQRAGEVIGRIRLLLKKTPPKPTDQDVNELIREVLTLL